MGALTVQLILSITKGGGFDRKTGGFDRTKWGHRPYKPGVLTVKIEGVFGEYMAQNLHLLDTPFPF